MRSGKGGGGVRSKGWREKSLKYGASLLGIANFVSGKRRSRKKEEERRGGGGGEVGGVEGEGERP